KSELRASATSIDTRIQNFKRAIHFVMKLSRQQKIYLVILVLALVALLVDRLFCSRQPAPAEAYTEPETVTAEASIYSDPLWDETIAGLPRSRVRLPQSGDTVSIMLDLPEPNSQGPRRKPARRTLWAGGLTQQLEILLPDEYLDLDQARDAFSLPAAWLDELRAQNPLGQADAAARFAKSHQLKAVLIEGKMREAYVDDHLLRPGQELDGFKLVTVNPSSATFEAGTKQVILKLKSDR
ncbi:MAG: hypothetical protein ACE5NM_13505, partial [Sedimentisphaerales bacterium]